MSHKKIVGEPVSDWLYGDGREYNCELPEEGECPKCGSLHCNGKHGIFNSTDMLKIFILGIILGGFFRQLFVWLQIG